MDRKKSKPLSNKSGTCTWKVIFMDEYGHIDMSGHRNFQCFDLFTSILYVELCLSDRVVRSIGPAYSQELNQTCMFFCENELTKGINS